MSVSHQANMGAMAATPPLPEKMVPVNSRERVPSIDESPRRFSSTKTIDGSAAGAVLCGSSDVITSSGAIISGSISSLGSLPAAIGNVASTDGSKSSLTPLGAQPTAIMAATEAQAAARAEAEAAAARASVEMEMVARETASTVKMTTPQLEVPTSPLVRCLAPMCKCLPANS